MTPDQQALVAAAREARTRAHAPFSGFHVGAAVRAASGAIYTGCNVEVSSYSHTCCAERVAVFKAVSEGDAELVACAVIIDDAAPTAPCGACRQVLHDFGPDMEMLLANMAGAVHIVPLVELLPRAFRPDQVLAHIRRTHGADESP